MRGASQGELREGTPAISSWYYLDLALLRDSPRRYSMRRKLVILSLLLVATVSAAGAKTHVQVKNTCFNCEYCIGSSCYNCRMYRC